MKLQHLKKSTIAIGQRWRETSEGQGIPGLLEEQDTKSRKPLVKDKRPCLLSNVRTLNRGWWRSGTQHTYSDTTAFDPIEPRKQLSSEDMRRTTDRSGSTLSS